jgi:hypothetical protein
MKSKWRKTYSVPLLLLILNILSVPLAAETSSSIQFYSLQWFLAIKKVSTEGIKAQGKGIEPQI